MSGDSGPLGSVPRGAKITVFVLVLVAIAVVFLLRSIPKAQRPSTGHLETVVITQQAPRSAGT